MFHEKSDLKLWAKIPHSRIITKNLYTLYSYVSSSYTMLLQTKSTPPMVQTTTRFLSCSELSKSWKSGLLHHSNPQCHCHRGNGWVRTPPLMFRPLLRLAQIRWKVFLYIWGCPKHVYCNFYCSQAKKECSDPHFFWAGDATANPCKIIHTSRFTIHGPKKPGLMTWEHYFYPAFYGHSYQ